MQVLVAGSEVTLEYRIQVGVSFAYCCARLPLGQDQAPVVVHVHGKVVWLFAHGQDSIRAVCHRLRVTSLCAQVYTPPYLLTGQPQPVLEHAPSSAIYGQNITVAFSNTTSIDRVVLSKLADNTHCISMDHRQVHHMCLVRAVHL